MTTFWAEGVPFVPDLTTPVHHNQGDSSTTTVKDHNLFLPFDKVNLNFECRILSQKREDSLRRLYVGDRGPSEIPGVQRKGSHDPRGWAPCSTSANKRTVVKPLTAALWSRKWGKRPWIRAPAWVYVSSEPLYGWIFKVIHFLLLFPPIIPGFSLETVSWNPFFVTLEMVIKSSFLTKSMLYTNSVYGGGFPPLRLFLGCFVCGSSGDWTQFLRNKKTRVRSDQRGHGHKQPKVYSF